MTRNDIATKLAQQVEGITPALAAKAVNGMIDIMSEALKENKAIYLRGFATIDTVERKAHNGYNFSNGKRIEVPARRVVRLKVSKEFFKSLNNK